MSTHSIREIRDIIIMQETEFIRMAYDNKY